jgi:DNA-binding SARP family transcriptional activator/tetratricopeptide (TPR) repeat protein
MRYGILGPLELWWDGAPVPVGGPQQRALLAVLLVHAGHVVSSDRLIDHLWGERPPRNARALLHGCVADLRKALRRDGTQPLRTRAPGYVLEVGPDEVDADRFERLAAAARAAVSPAEAAAHLYRALALWRGDPLDGVAAEGLAPVVARLRERRLEVLEQRIALDLRLGRHQGLAAELRVLVREHPLRERLWSLLMLVLQRTGRQADALAVYRELRETLVDQLGVEPGPATQRVHRAVLGGSEVDLDLDEAPAGAGGAGPVPAQLPAAVSAFTGRADVLKRLDELADNRDDMVLAVVTGMGGAGKTALAVHWAHQVRDRYPDGQLYVNLRGFAAGRPAAPVEALTGFLRAFGVPPEQVPAETEPAAALYRSTLAGRRVLVVLDNAASADQVRPLLPGTPGCLVVVTSRDRLRGLVARDGARRVELGMLGPDEATVLLGRMLGADRVAAEPAAAAELARMCAYLPLAVRIAAADVTGSIADHVDRLRRADRLSAFDVPGDPASAVRASFEFSYAALDPAACRLFRLLGTIPAGEVGAPAAAALAGRPEPETRQVLDRLLAVHLLEPAGPDRYTCHDLLASYAAERAVAQEEAVAREAALGRWFGWYVDRADAAARMLYPELLRLPDPGPAAGARTGGAAGAGFADHQAALSWLDTERATLVGAVRYAAKRGPRRAGYVLADLLRGYFWLRMYRRDWMEVARAGLAAAAAAGDVAGQAAASLSLGDAHSRQGRYAEAVEHYARCGALSRQVGWLDGESAAAGCIGNVHWWEGNLPAAAEHYERALELAERTGRLGGQAANLGNLGQLYSDLGKLATSAAYHRRALALDHRLGSTLGEAVELGNLGMLELEQGRLEAAFELLERSLTLQREVGNRDGEADTIRVLAEAHRAAGRLDRALALAGQAVALARDTGGVRYEADARNALGRCELALRRPDRAIAQHERALALVADSANRYAEIEALTGLAAAHEEADRAVDLAGRAVTLARQAGYGLAEGYALRALGDAHHRAGDVPGARAAWQRAREVLSACGSAAAQTVRARLSRSGAPPSRTARATPQRGRG